MEYDWSHPKNKICKRLLCWSSGKKGCISTNVNKTDRKRKAENATKDKQIFQSLFRDIIATSSSRGLWLNIAKTPMHCVGTYMSMQGAANIPQISTDGSDLVVLVERNERQRECRNRCLTQLGRRCFNEVDVKTKTCV